MLPYLRGIVTFFFMVTKTINLTVPRGWHELDDKQLRYLFGLLAEDYSSAEIRTLCLFRFARLDSTSPKISLKDHSNIFDGLL